jgi:hypothetical protein
MICRYLCDSRVDPSSSVLVGSNAVMALTALPQVMDSESEGRFQQEQPPEEGTSADSEAELFHSPQLPLLPLEHPQTRNDGDEQKIDSTKLLQRKDSANEAQDEASEPLMDFSKANTQYPSSTPRKPALKLHDGLWGLLRPMVCSYSFLLLLATFLCQCVHYHACFHTFHAANHSTSLHTRYPEIYASLHMEC